MGKRKENLHLDLRSADRSPLQDGIDEVVIDTDKGKIHCRLHAAPGSRGAVVWVGGAGGGLDGPAGGLYLRMAGRLAREGISSLRLDYRRPNFLLDCILDTLAGVIYLEEEISRRVVLVGHSFGGAVVISAGVASESVIGVAGLSSQSYGTDLANQLSPRALLLLHGSADQVLPDVCSRDIYQRAAEPRQVIIYPGCGHGLVECREQVDRDLLSWIRAVFLKRSASGGLP
jgi:pimeloyl-ACP methyl ester carboxylesterase